MKKINKPLLTLILIIVASLALYIGFFFIEIPKGLDILWFILLQIAGFILIIPTFIFFHEFGHLVFGLKSGYSLLMFRFGPLSWIRDEDHKIKFSFQIHEFFALGQCLMSPPKPHKKHKTPFFLYNAGGLIFSYIYNILLLILFFIIPLSYIKWLILAMLFVATFLTLNNTVYLDNGMNDVCNAVRVRKNPKCLDSILYQLEMLSNISLGKRYGAKTQYNGYYGAKLDHLTFPVAQFMFLQEVDRGNFEKAEEHIRVIAKNTGNLHVPVQKVAALFEVLWADIVIMEDMSIFKRHYKRIGAKEMFVCNRYPEYNTLFNMYTDIYEKKYDVTDYLEKILNKENFGSGEFLSIEKKFNFLKDKLDFYVKNDESFVVKGEPDEIL